MVDLNERRREVLYSLVSLAGAGLLKVVWDQRNQRKGLRVTHSVGSTQSGASSTFRIDEGDFTIWEFAFDQPNRLQYTMEVIQGPAIDVILTDDPYPLPDDRTEWNYYPDTSRLNVKEATVTDTLPPGNNYLLVFDNSNRLEAKPPTNLMNDAAIVTFQFSLSPIETETPTETEGTPDSTPTETATPTETTPTVTESTPTESGPSTEPPPTETETSTDSTATDSPGGYRTVTEN